MPNNVTAKFGAKDNLSSELDKINAKFEKLRKQGAKGIAIGAGAAVTAKGINLAADALGGLANAAFDSIQAASDLGEQLSKSNVVFGKSASIVEDFADKSADAFGISKRAALEAAGTYGNFFVGLGQTEDAAAKMSTKLVGLASDLASFNNIDPGEVLDKLRAGLAGEAEPLRRLGVFLTAAKVEAKAMEMGLADANGEVSEGAKVMARYQLILDETTTAQGDFARTSGSMANQQRELNAKLEDTSAVFGQKLIPIVVEFQTVIIRALDQTAIGFDEVAEAASRGSQAAEAHKRAMIATGHGAEDAADKLDRSERSIVGSTAQISGGFSGMAQEAKEATKVVARSFDDMVKDLSDDVSTLIDEVYDPQILHDRLLADQAEYAAQRKIATSKNSTKEEKREARARMRELSKSADETRLALLEAGELTAEDAKEWLAKLRKRYAKETGTAKEKVGDLIAYVERLMELTQNPIKIKVVETHGDRGNNAKGGKASGGPAFGRTLVGEQGPEWLDLPSGSFVHDAKKTQQMGPGGGGDIFNITFTGPVGGDQNNLLRQVDRARRVAANRKVA